ncbi:MAG: hypothetical protein HC824_19480 [Synechococcales cyanobacterium RM1_1_8]|nr:hypothetical protein [Synechococcales cyanobacterium RM1_1_8]
MNGPEDASSGETGIAESQDDEPWVQPAIRHQAVMKAYTTGGVFWFRIGW